MKTMKYKIVTLLILFMLCAKSSHALRCENSLVHTGDSKNSVRGKCGSPLLTEYWTIETSKKLYIQDFIDNDKNFEKNKNKNRNKNKIKNKIKKMWEALALEYIEQIKIDVWTYNFGPDNFTYDLTFKDNQLVEITHGNYGYKELETSKSPSHKPNNCTHVVISEGTKKIDLLAKCGPPTEKETITDIKVNKKYRNSGDIFWKERISNNKEMWTYNFRPNNFIYHIEIVNGTVTKYSTSP